MTLPFPLFRLCASAASAALLLGSTYAVDLPSIRLDTIYPPGAQVGTEAQVNLTGDNLDEAKTLLFSHPGITAEPKDKGYVIKVAPEVPVGVYDVRVTGLFGVSNPRAFAVGHLPEGAKVKPAATPDTAGELPLDTVYSGVITASAESYYKFTAKKGQRLLVECATSEIDSRFTPVLAILDPAGTVLEASSRGGLLDLTAPADSTYHLRMHDLTYGGGAAHFFRLTLKTGPHLDFIFPPASQPGTKGKFTVYGRNLPGGAPADLQSLDGKPLQKLEVEIEAPKEGEIRYDGVVGPASAAVDGFPYRLKTPQSVSNALFIGLSVSPVIAEVEPNNQAEKAQKITTPCEVAGQFFPAGDADNFTFEAKKGEAWWIEVISNRLGLPTNPFVLVQREAAVVQEGYGTEMAATEKRFSTASNDPSFRFEAKEDGVHRISVRDLSGGARRDPRNVYRLLVQRETPDFRLTAVSEPATELTADRTAIPRTPLLRPGGTVPVRVIAFRRGFTGDIELSAEGLPEGVTCGPTKIPAGKNDGILLLTAGEKVAKWVGPVRICGKAKAGETEIVREARGGAGRWSVTDINLDLPTPRLTRDFFMATSDADPAPMQVLPAEEKVFEAVAGAKLEIPIKVTRQKGFADALKIKAGGAPGLETMKEVDLDAKAATGKITIDLATMKVPPGEHTIYLQTPTKGKFRGKDITTTIFSTPIQIAVKAPAPKK